MRIRIPIRVTRRYTETERRSVPKFVECENCHLQYVYYLRRKVSVEWTSTIFFENEGAVRSAQQEVDARLRRALEKGCEPIPCPGCGHVQQHMVARARQLRRRWMAQAGLYLFPSACILALPASLVLFTALGMGDREGWTTRWIIQTIIGMLLCLTAAAAAAGAVVLPAWKYFTCRTWDPNSEDLEDRKQQGQSLAVPREEFEQRQAKTAAPEALRAAPPLLGAWESKMALRKAQALEKRGELAAAFNQFEYVVQSSADGDPSKAIALEQIRQFRGKSQGIAAEPSAAADRGRSSAS